MRKVFDQHVNPFVRIVAFAVVVDSKKPGECVSELLSRQNFRNYFNNLTAGKR